MSRGLAFVGYLRVVDEFLVVNDGYTRPLKGVFMDNQNLVLYVASYGDAASAAADYKALRDAESGTDLLVLGAVVVSKDDDGKIDVDEKGAPQAVGGAVVGGGIGAIVGLFAPPFLLAAAVGAGIGAIAGELTKKHEEKKLGVDLDEYLPDGSSAILVVMEDMYLDRVEGALSNANKNINKAIDSGDYEQIQKAIADSDDDVADAIDS